MNPTLRSFMRGIRCDMLKTDHSVIFTAPSDGAHR